METNDKSRCRPIIPDHELLRCIGHGSYGEVWLARNIFGVYRAVKVVYRKAFENERPFERELAGIYKFEPISRSHEGFVDILHIGRNDAEGYFYYVMELADDRRSGQEIDPKQYIPKTLEREPLKESKIPIAECLQLGLSLSSALSQLHKQNLVHRDIKPSNIIFVHGAPKLADIGLVAEIKEAQSFVGTEGFVPREGPGSPQADIFSLGKVLYEISTGADRRDFPRMPSGCDKLLANPQFLELNEIILTACQNDASERYQSAEEMYADLAFLLNGKSVKRLRLLERRVAWMTRAGVTAAILLVLLGLGYFQFDRERKHRVEIRQREVGSQTAHGIEALEQGQYAEALPFFIRLLRLDSPERAPMHRARIGMILEQCPKLLQMWPNAARINDGQFSRDGRFLVLASQTNGAIVVDIETGKIPGPVFGPPGVLRSVRFNPDGSQILAASEDHTATVWEWRTGRRVLRLVDSNMVSAATFNSSGDRIVTACADGSARVWNASSGELLRELSRHTEQVVRAVFSPDDKLIATAGRDKSVFLWNAANGEFLNRTLAHQQWVNDVYFSPDGLRLATACSDRTAHVWDLSADKEIFPALKHRDGVWSVEFSPDGRFLLTGCLDSTARLWEAATGRSVSPNGTLHHSSRVLHASFHPDGHRLVTTCLDGTSRLWDLAASTPTPVMSRASFSPAGTKFLVQSNRWLQARDTRSNRPFQRIDLGSPLKEVRWSRTGRFLLTLCSPAEPDKNAASELAVWESETGHRLFSLPSFSGTLKQVAVSDDGQRMVCFWTNRARVYDLGADPANSKWLVLKRIIQSASFSPNGQELLTIWRNELQVWNLNTQQPRFGHKLPIDLRAAQFSPDSKVLAACCSDLTLRECSAQLWNLPDGKPLGRPLLHGDGVLSVAFSPKGNRVVTASEDATAVIWDLFSGHEPKTLRHENEVHDATFNQDGSRVLTVSRDQSACLWDAESGEPISPPLGHPASLWHGVFLDENSFLTSDDKGNSWIWEVTTDPRPVEHLMLIAEILNGTRPAVSTSTATTETSYTVWRNMKDKYPQEFATSRPELIAWHRQQAALSSQERQWAAALFHYDRLLALDSHDEEIIRLRAEAVRRLEAPHPASVSR